MRSARLAGFVARGASFVAPDIGFVARGSAQPNAVAFRGLSMI